MIAVLHPAIGSNRFCGPAALAMVTGLTTDKTAAAIRQVTGKTRVFGVTPTALIKAAEVCGIRLVYVDSVRGETRFPWPLESSGLIQEGTSLRRAVKGLTAGLYVAWVTGHYVALSVEPDVILVGDNQSVYPRELVKFRRANKHTKMLWKVTKL